MMREHLFLFTIILFSGCTLDTPDKDKLPIWSTTIEIPIIQTRIDLDTFLEDSLISVNEDSIYVFNKTEKIDSVEVGDQLKIDPIEKNFVQYASAVTVDSSNTTFAIGYDSVGLDDIAELINAKIGLVELDNIGSEETDPISFTDIMPPEIISSIEAAIAANGDSANVVVDTVAIVPQQRSINFDSFTSANVSSGYIDVTIANSLFIPLGAPIYIHVKNNIGTSIFQLVWDTEIPSGSSSSTLSQDVSGMTLPGTMLVEVYGTSNGSQGNTVTVDTMDLNSKFTVELAARDFKVTQANAIVPVQSITDTSSIVLDPSETIVEEAIMSNGDLNIVVSNNLPLTGDVELVIPSLYFKKADSTFTQNFELGTGTFSVPAADMTGWMMVLDYADQRLHYHYLITTNDTDPNSVTIDSSDNVELDLAITDIFFSEVTGQIESQTIIEEGDIFIESESQIQSASISAGQMDLVINNNIGGVADVCLTIPELVHNGMGLDTVFTINYGDNAHTITLIGYDLVPVSLDDQRLTYGTTTITQSGSDTYYLNDSINVDINLPELTFDAVTGYISQEDNVETDIIELESETKVETALIDSGWIQLLIQNFIGLEAYVLFEIEELTLDGASLESSFEIMSTNETTQHTIDLSGYRLTLPLDDQKVTYSSTLGILSDQLLSLTLNDSISIDLLIDTLWFGSVTGIIDTVEVTIDTIEQEISALPEEMDGFEFANVEICLDFESNISIPVFLDLTMEASNNSGDTSTSSILYWNISDSSRVIIPNAKELINIQPDMILAYGSARIGGDGMSGTIMSDQTITGLLSVRAPLELEIGSDAVITTDPELTTEADAGETVPAEIEEILVYIHYDNEFEFGTAVTVLMSQDTTHFNDGTANVLMDSMLIPAGKFGLDSLDLNDDRLRLFNQDSMYVQTKINLLGQIDENGEPIPSKFLSTDTLQLNIYARIQYLMDGAELVGGDD